jgi:hypothetical protein
MSNPKWRIILDAVDTLQIAMSVYPDEFTDIDEINENLEQFVELSKKLETNDDK